MRVQNNPFCSLVYRFQSREVVFRLRCLKSLFCKFLAEIDILMVLGLRMQKMFRGFCSCVNRWSSEMTPFRIWRPNYQKCEALISIMTANNAYCRNLSALLCFLYLVEDRSLPLQWAPDISYGRRGTTLIDRPDRAHRPRGNSQTQFKVVRGPDHTSNDEGPSHF